MKYSPMLAAMLGLVVLSMPDARADPRSRPHNPSPGYYVTVPVMQVDPIYSSRTTEQPVRHCTSTRSTASSDYQRPGRYRTRRHDDYPHYPQENYFLQGLFGGIVGGLIGNQFGGGNGKKALTVVGALAGSSIARDIARSQSRTRYPGRNCHTTYESQVVEDISGYDVTYEYRGQQFSKRVAEHPGDSVRVRVQLTPEFDRD